MGCTTSAALPVTEQIKEHLRVNARHYLSFTREVDQHVCLYCSERVRAKAIQRYETLWLPLLLSLNEEQRVALTPPLDVHFVWYCHMLSPAEYAEDLQRLGAAQVLDHALQSESERERGREKARALWESRYDAPFAVDLEDEDLRLLESAARAQGVALSNHAHLSDKAAQQAQGVAQGGAGSLSSLSLLGGGGASPTASLSHSSLTQGVTTTHSGRLSSSQSALAADDVSLSFSPSPSPSLSNAHTALRCDLDALMQSQQSAHYQFSLPHYRTDTAFLSQAAERYAALFPSLSLSLSLSLTPQHDTQYDMQWMLCTHLLAPRLFARHTHSLSLSLDVRHGAPPGADDERRAAPVEGSLFRGDPRAASLSVALLRRAVHEFEGYYPRDVRIAGAFGRGWAARVERINTPSLPHCVAPPRARLTAPRRYQQMDHADKVQQDREFDDYERELPLAQRDLQRLNINDFSLSLSRSLSLPATLWRIKRWAQLTGGLRAATLLSLSGSVVELFLKNDLVASCHSLSRGQCRHSVFGTHCACTTAPHSERESFVRPRCAVLLLRVAGQDQALLHGQWTNASASTSSSSAVLCAHPAVCAYGLALDELQSLSVSPSPSPTVDGKGEDEAVPVYALRSVSRLLGHDSVEDGVAIEPFAAAVTGERNAPPLVSVLLALSVSLLFSLLRPVEEENEKERGMEREKTRSERLQDDEANPFFVATGARLATRRREEEEKKEKEKDALTEREGETEREWDSFLDMRRAAARLADE